MIVLILPVPIQIPIPIPHPGQAPDFMFFDFSLNVFVPIPGVGPDFTVFVPIPAPQPQWTEAQSFVSSLWDHFAVGAALPTEDPAANFSRNDLRDAILMTPEVLKGVADHGYTEADVWAYAQAETPWAVELVGIA